MSIKSETGKKINVSEGSDAPSDKTATQAERLATVFELDDEGARLSFFGGNCRIRVANNLKLRDRAYRFIYKIYRGLGYANSNSMERWLTVFDALPDTATLISENKKGNTAGVLTLVFDSPMGLPGDSMFKPELDALRAQNARLCESMSFATAENSRGSVKTIAGLFYCGYLLAWRVKAATHWTTNVIESHERFYCRNLLFERVGPVKNCSRARGLPVVLLVLPFQLPNMLRNVRRIFPLSMLDFSYAEERAIADRLGKLVSPMSTEMFSEFYNGNTEVYESASDQQKQFLYKLYDPHP
jgi:hypothetical protein